MGMQGNLHDMAVADLIQQCCLGQKTARLLIQHDGEESYIYFKEGRVTHAESTYAKGEEVVFQVLDYLDGSFNLDPGVEPLEESITRSYSGLLLEAAKRLDETQINKSIFSELQPDHEFQNATKEMKMAQKVEELLKELSGEINGYMASSIVGMDGISIASHTVSKIDKEAVSAQLTLMMKLVDTSVKNYGNLSLEDSLTTTERVYFLMRYLPGKEFFLSIIADRKTANLGNLRLLSKIYGERISKAMPH